MEKWGGMKNALFHRGTRRFFCMYDWGVMPLQHGLVFANADSP